MSRLLTVTAGALLVALLAFGCGGSGGDDATQVNETTEVVSKAQFVKQAQKACEEVGKKRKAAVAGWQKKFAGKVATEEQLSEVFKDAIVPSIEEEVEALEALPVPAKDKPEIEKMIANLAAAGQKISTEGTKGTQGKELADFQRWAYEYDLEVCGRVF